MRTYKTNFEGLRALCHAYAGKTGRIDGRTSGPPSAMGLTLADGRVFQVNTDTKAEALAFIAEAAQSGATIGVIPTKTGKRLCIGVNGRHVAGFYAYFMGKKAE